MTLPDLIRFVVGNIEPGSWIDEIEVLVDLAALLEIFEYETLDDLRYDIHNTPAPWER